MNQFKNLVAFIACLVLLSGDLLSDPSLKRKVFIHFGPPKTGSSIIQSALSHNKEKLHSVGYSYIDCEDYWYSGASTYFYAIFYGETPSENDYAQAKKSFQDQIEKLPSDHNLIISHENFIGSSDLTKFKTLYPHHRKTFLAIKRLFGELGFEVYPIFYIKSQDKFFESCYAESINAFGTLTFDEFIIAIDVLAFDWKTIIDSMEEIFDDRVSIKAFEEIYCGKEKFLSSFLDSIRANDLKISESFLLSIPSTSAHEDNVSYSGIGLCCLKYLNKVLGREYLEQFRPFLKMTLNSKIWGKATFFSKSFRHLIHKYYLYSNNYIIEKYKLNKFSKYYGLD